MRLGTYVAKLEPESVARRAYGADVVSERHRHRFEVNNRYRARLEEAGLSCSGVSPDARLVEIVELSGHSFFVASQFHPEFQSRPTDPAPLFREFVGAAVAYRDRRRSAAVPVADSGKGESGAPVASAEAVHEHSV